MSATTSDPLDDAIERQLADARAREAEQSGDDAAAAGLEPELPAVVPDEVPPVVLFSEAVEAAPESALPLAPPLYDQDAEAVPWTPPPWAATPEPPVVPSPPEAPTPEPEPTPPAADQPPTEPELGSQQWWEVHDNDVEHFITETNQWADLILPSDEPAEAESEVTP